MYILLNGAPPHGTSFLLDRPHCARPDTGCCNCVHANRGWHQPHGELCGIHASQEDGRSADFQTFRLGFVFRLTLRLLGIPMRRTETALMSTTLVRSLAAMLTSTLVRSDMSTGTPRLIVRSKTTFEFAISVTAHDKDERKVQGNQSLQRENSNQNPVQQRG